MMTRRKGKEKSKSVRFHTGPESNRRNDFMGSSAYTRGGVCFGRRGFVPSVTAHELVHTRKWSSYAFSVIATRSMQISCRIRIRSAVKTQILISSRIYQRPLHKGKDKHYTVIEMR